MRKTPTLVIGLDGATYDIIEPMVKEGKLPNIARLMEEGSKTILMSSTPPLSSIAWTTITTGVNPGKHGLYDFAHRAEGTYEFVPYTSRDKKEVAIWDILSDQGKKVCVVNVPLTYPAEKVNGVMISGFPSPKESDDWVYPRSLASELRKNLGDLDFQKPTSLIGAGEEEKLLAELEKTTRVQVKILWYLLNREEYDFVMTVFDGIDTASHSLWKYLDKNHPKYDPKRAEIGSKVFYRSYELADEAIGQLLGLFKTPPNVMLLSDHGNGPVYYGVYINNWLAKGGHLVFKRNPTTRAKLWAFNRGFNLYNVFRVARKLGLLPSLEAAYAKDSFAISLAKRFSLSFLDVDWSKTRAYSFGNYGQIYVNLKGREPEGVVQPGPEYDAYVERLADELQNLNDPKSGKPIFDQIYTNPRLYQGPRSGDGPDLLFLDSQMLYDAHRFFEFATNQLVTPHPVYSGNHKPEGILVCAVPDMKGSATSSPASIEDVTPTLMALCGLEVPHYMDGRILESMIGKKHLEGGLVAPTQAKDREQTPVFSEAENAELIARLKDLGYA